MRILQVTPGYTPELGGVELHVQMMSEALAKRGHEVVVVTSTKDQTLLQHEIIGGVAVQRFRAFGSEAYKYPVGLFGYLRQQAQYFDIVHAHNYHALPLLQAALACQKRTVVTPYYHGHGHTRFADALHHIYNPFAMAAVRATGGIICISPSEAELVANRFHIDRLKITVIPSITTISDANSKVIIGREPKVSGQEQYILIVGRLDIYKQVDRVIAAIPYLPVEFKLIIIGSGTERSKLEQLVNDLDISDRVQFLGRVSDEELQWWYQKSTLTISLSNSEAFGRVIIEALAAGCFVVCNDIPAFHDFADEFPKAVSLVPSTAMPQDIAEAIWNTSKQQPIHLSLRQYTQQVIIDDIERTYMNSIKINQSNQYTYTYKDV